jgi:MFS family permease
VSDWLVARSMNMISGRRLPPILGLLASGTFTGLAAIATTASTAVPLIALAMFFMQFGITCKWILVTIVRPQAYCASAASNQNFAGFLGGTLSPVLTGFIVDQTESFAFCADHWRRHYRAWSDDLPVLHDHYNRRRKAGRTHSKARGFQA